MISRESNLVNEIYDLIKSVIKKKKGKNLYSNTDI